MREVEGSLNLAKKLHEIKRIKTTKMFFLKP